MAVKHGTAISISTVDEYRKIVKSKDPQFHIAFQQGVQGTFLSSTLAPLVLNLGAFLVIALLRLPGGSGLDFCLLPFVIIFALWGGLIAISYWRMLRQMSSVLSTPVA